jgi:hypothetical protein
MNGLYGTSPLFGSAGSGVGSAKRHSGVLGSSPRTGGGSGGHASVPGTSYGLGTSAPLAKFQHPSHALLEQQGFKQIVYKKYHKRCLEERAQKGEALHVLFAVCHIVGTADRVQVAQVACMKHNRADQQAGRGVSLLQPGVSAWCCGREPRGVRVIAGMLRC